MNNRRETRQRRRASTIKHEALLGPARLVVIEGRRIGRKLTLDRERMLVGRGEDADLVFADPDLSRRHAAIERLGPMEYRIVDLGSSNGTFVNGVPVDRPTPLQLGDKIRFGRRTVAMFTMHDPIEAQVLQRQRLEALGRLAAGVAHDFNNMLSALLANVEFLRSQPPAELAPEQLGDCLDDMQDAAERAAELSKRLLRFARGDRQPSTVVSATAVCEELSQIVRRTFDRSTIIVATRIAPDLAVEADGMELHQVLMNLCLNARDAMPEGGTLTIHADLTRHDERVAAAGLSPDLAYVRIAVRDTGRGMSPDTQARAFDPFFTTKGSGGFGLGLATVREMVSELGGIVCVDSALGVGSCFTVYLPAADPARCSQASERPRHTSRRLRHLTRSLLVLVVDDELVVRRGARRLLLQAGHRVLEAGTGAEAVNVYLAHHPRPDVVLLDLEMPRMGGEEALAELLAADRDASVLMLSGHHDQGRVAALEQKGARGFLSKPWTADALLDMLDRIGPRIERTDRPPDSLPRPGR